MSDEFRALTTIVVSQHAPRSRMAALARHVNVLVAPAAKRRARNAGPYHVDLRWLLGRLGAEEVTSLLVEGGGEVNASFLLGGFAQRVVFFYAPRILGGRDSRKAVAGDGVRRLDQVIQLHEVQWRQFGPDLLFTARVSPVAG